MALLEAQLEACCAMHMVSTGVEPEWLRLEALPLDPQAAARESLQLGYHPLLLQLRRRVMELHSEVAVLSQGCAFRPQPSQYTALRQCVQEFCFSLAAPNVIVTLVDGLEQAAAAAKVGNVASSILAEAQHWIATADGFCSKLQNRFVCYLDLCEPLLLATSCIRRGLR